jgi:hypothetical protein
MRRFYFLLTVLVLFAVGCRSTKILETESISAFSPPANTIIYIIHGDANYLYHNANGYPLQADEQVLKESKKVAENATNSEVFIFHQRPEQKFIWLFPKKDRRFLYYKNGNLISDKRYSPHSDEQSFVTEAQLYNRYHKVTEDTAGHRKVLLYFGHEIPESTRNPYHASRPKVPFDTPLFAQGIQLFLQQGETPFDLTVLSTCDNGTPAMIKALNPYTNYVLASPQNLHLSHIDTGRLSSLLEQADTTAKQLADSLAAQTYSRLSSFLQTVITLSVYDTNITNSYLPSLNRSYQAYLSDEADAEPSLDNTDCATLPFFDTAEYKKGVDVWYKPPRFGQKKDAATYSGWGCRKRE